MRKYTSFILLLCVLLSISACDFLRKAAGRPTSADIEAKRELIIQDSLAKKAIADSLERERQIWLAYVADSLAVLDTFAQRAVFIKPVAEVASLRGTQLSARYWLVVGAFKNKSYADKLVLKLEKAGFESRSVTPARGLITVITAPNETVRSLFDEYKRYVASDLYNPQVWILDAAPAAATE